MNWQLKTGSIFDFGTTLTDEGCNFAIHAPLHHHLTLVLFDDNDVATYLPMVAHHNGTHSLFVSDLPSHTKYAYRGNLSGEICWILDPYAALLADNPECPNTPAALTYHQQFDWGQTRHPNIDKNSTIINEIHVKGFTKRHPDVPEHLQGKFLGLCHPSVVEHFKQLGVTSLQLLPIATSHDEPHLQDKKLTNYWGYNTLSWFAPDSKFAVEDPILELKQMVKTLHQNNIEVILDVVYNHTAESGEGGPEFHLKRLDKSYYLQDANKNYLNFTGCGNTLDLTYQPSLNIVLDNLRYWVEEFQIDGFRFDLAATLGRNGNRFNKDSAFFKAIAQDPVLKRVKLIAEPWDIGPDGYQLGHFPAEWNECNDKFRDTVKSYWLCHERNIKEFATRFMGSRDLFSAGCWPGKLPVNYVAYHDGYTLQDLVSYNHKHNHANGEDNRDGHGDNRSNNQGIEGETTNYAVLSRRERQKRNLMTTLLFSFGIPHILGVDALSHSQGGNNNAYCQDNEISWADWTPNKDKSDFTQWLSTMIARRQQYMMPFISAFSGHDRGHHRIHWWRSNGHVMDAADWQGLEAFALYLGLFDSGNELMFLINNSVIPTRYRLPEGSKWKVVCDTSEAALGDRQVQTTYMQGAQSLTILYRD
ncbi:glycogen debranching protein [Photobacterium rosenbergii]|uniref:glycogen debranching protein n=1 Tax=Photobacterium rosenbergii TaxID=294936 RepID=UPI001C99CD86|nr:alpha-amylase family glycosyl hydrolase [Photobacterium rosenbergii]MBY5944350.1 glycogen debranching enzyme [Photobacterium rosenbergii]